LVLANFKNFMCGGGAMLPFAKKNMKALIYDIVIDYPISSLRGSLWYDHAISLNVQSLK